MLEPSASEGLSSLPLKYPINLLIGPEGGFSERDLATAEQLNIKGVKMGPRILRTETAGLTALAILQSHLGT